MSTADFTIRTLGKASLPSPVKLSNRDGDYTANYVDDGSRIIHDLQVNAAGAETAFKDLGLMEEAGPREKIYFEPSKVHAGIVTCGGLCPGLNDVIRSVVLALWHEYGVRRITGFRYGYRGFLPDFNIPTVELDPEKVATIHEQGGTMLGSSRGSGDRVPEIVDCLERMNINMLFTLGGDGTQKGAAAIAAEAEQRGLKIAVAGIPKTIDNDLSYTDRSFGFETSVQLAVQAVAGAHVEARDAVNGIGLVKVMGRESGFIAAHTALANNDVNFVLIPEVPFDLAGENGFLAHLEKRLERRHHAVILAAEGAGQDLMEGAGGTDASGNKKLTDIGLYLKQEIGTYFKGTGTEINLKYIDPSYIIRSAPANANDSLLCQRLGNDAVHAAMAGKTSVLVTLCNNRFVHVPISLATQKRNYINPDNALWRDVVNATGQGLMKNG